MRVARVTGRELRDEDEVGAAVGGDGKPDPGPAADDASSAFAREDLRKRAITAAMLRPRDSLGTVMP